ncbi:glycosyltransferase WbuB [Stutzerimonas frequens]|uniref:glycosyltransferase family 4 protein n=1 Tax=Stutzerimonas frequens TaxID=2968969 RepID=UPI000D7E1B76|nr:glycosyltransferase family 4 protein [Stutzerimonas frequens]AWT09852.1 glycosyltransferase WbuB [Stutzerimonas frequens]
MKIVYIHQYFKTPQQSGGTRSYEMARRLVKWGHEVHVVTSWTETSDTKGWSSQVIEGIHVHWLPVFYNNRMGFSSRLRAFLRFSLKASSKAIALRGDIVFASSTPLTIALPGILASFITRRSLVFEVRDLWPEIPIAMGVLKNSFLIACARFLEKFTYRYAAHIVALSPGMARGIESTAVSEDKITIIPNGADLDLFNPEGIASGIFRRSIPGLSKGPILLYPGTLGKVNGVEYLVQLAFQVRKLRGDINFVVIGDGAEREKVLELASSLGVLNDNFYVFDPMPKEELVFAFRDASLIFSLIIDLPALENNSANKFFDALAAGKAVAINHGGWQKDLIEEHNVGLALSRDIGVAALSIVEFFQDISRAEACGQNAYNLAVRGFDRDRLAKLLEKVLLDACGKSND